MQIERLRRLQNLTLRWFHGEGLGQLP